MVLVWAVGVGGTSYHFLATVCLAILRVCEFVLFFVFAVAFRVGFFFGLRYPLPSTGGWAYIFLASLDIKWLKTESHIISSADEAVVSEGLVRWSGGALTLL
jgi:hypothetical protein